MDLNFLNFMQDFGNFCKIAYPPPHLTRTIGGPFYEEIWGVLVFLNFPHFSPERKENGSLGATKSEV